MSDIKVTAIVPAYNVEIYLEKCLTNLVNQTLKDIEIIVIDDGSTDRTNEIMQEFAKKDSRIITITQTNQKQGAARNRALEIAKGEYVSFVDSDDWIDLDYFEKMYNAASKYNADWAVSNSIREKGKKQRFHFKFNETKFYEGTDAIMNVVKLHWEPHSKIYKADIAKEIKFKEQVFFEDDGYSIRFINRAKNIVTVHDTAYHYISNPNSTIKGKSSTAKVIDRIEASVDAINFAKENGINIPEKLIIKETKGPFSIKHFMDKKVYQLFGIKIFTKKEKFDNSKTFLVFNTSCFGDVLLCNSLCQNIKRVFPDSKTVFICDKPFYEVAKYQKDVDDVVIYDKRGKHKGLIGFIKFLSEFKYKKAFASFITYRNMRNLAVSKLTGTKYIYEAQKLDIKLSTQDKHNQLIKPLTHKKIENLPIRYEVEDSLPEIVKEFFNNDKKYIALCTTSKLIKKDMPIEVAIDLINKINEKGKYEVVFVGAGPKSKEYAQNLEEMNCKFINLVNKTTIYGLAQVLKACEKVISVDTGTLHLACALDIPVTAIFYNEAYLDEWAPSEELYKVNLITENHTAENILKNIN